MEVLSKKLPPFDRSRRPTRSSWNVDLCCFLNFQIDFVAHDDIPYSSAGSDDVYKHIKEAGGSGSDSPGLPVRDLLYFLLHLCMAELCLGKWLCPSGNKICPAGSDSGKKPSFGPYLIRPGLFHAPGQALPSINFYFQSSYCDWIYSHVLKKSYSFAYRFLQMEKLMNLAKWLL